MTTTPPTSPFPANETGKTNGTHKKNKHQQKENQHPQQTQAQQPRKEAEIDDDEYPPHQTDKAGHEQQQEKTAKTAKTGEKKKIDQLLGEDMKAVKQVISYIPFSDMLLNTSVYVYQTVTPQLIQTTVEKQVLPRANPLLETACEYVVDDVVPRLQHAADTPSAIYKYVIKTTHSTIDYVLPPLSEETEKAAKTAFAIPGVITGRLRERSHKVVEADLREIATTYVTDFVDKVETSDESGKEVSVYRLLNDMLILLQTTPLTAALPRSVALPGKAPAQDTTTTAACNKLLVDSRDFTIHLANQLMDRYHAGQSQLLHVVEQAVNSLKKTTTTAATTTATATDPTAAH